MNIRRIGWATAATVAMTTVIAAAWQLVLYVDGDATPGGDGTSWNTAYRFLQDALTDACVGGIDEIHVGQGTYIPDRDEANPDGTGDREATFQLCNGVALMGGYAGFGAKNPDDRDTELYETILSGDLLGNDGPDFANNDENSYNVTTGSGTDGTAVLDGFPVTAGNGNGPGGPGDNLPHWRAGGMLNLTGSPTVTGCRFIANSASAGGGMNNAFDSSPIVTNCTFIGNMTAVDARGGMANVFGSSPIVTNCTFNNNTSALSGGGMFNRFAASPMLTSCTFSGNTATTDFGGGMANFDNSNPTVTDCTFESNIAPLRGGGMHNFQSSPTVTNCLFENNSSFRGGGMRNAGGSNPTITNCTFADNSADPNNGLGGGMSNFNSSPAVADSFFCGNEPDHINGQWTDDGGNEFLDECPPCPWDLDANGSVGAADLVSLLVSWGPCKDCSADFDGNGTVGASDLLALLANWGPCP